MRLTVPRLPGTSVSPPARERHLRPGARVQARVVNVFTGRLRLVRVGKRRLLMQSDVDSAIGDTLDLEVIALRPLPRFRHVASGRTIWSIPMGWQKDE